MDIAGVLVHALETRWRRVSSEFSRNRRHSTEPGVHDLRVATRRLVAAFDIARAVVPGDVDLRMRRALKRCLKSFSALRDLHVLILNLRPLARRFPVIRPMLREAVAREVQLVREAGRIITRFDAPAVGRNLSSVALSLSVSAGDAPGMDAARAVVLGAVAARYLRVMRRRQALSAADPRTIHRLRIAFKQFRYSIEVLQLLLPQVTKKELRAMNEFQNRMGEIQDCEVLIGAVREFAATRVPANPASFLSLHQYLALHRRALVDAFISRADAISSFWPGGRD